MRQFSLRTGFGILIIVLAISLLPNFVRGAAIPMNWIVVQNMSQGYRLYRPPEATVIWYTPEGILHVKLDHGSSVMTVQVLDNPARLDAQEFSDVYLLNPDLRTASERVLMVPAIEREQLSVAGRLAETWVVAGPVVSSRRVVVSEGEQTYLLHYPEGEKNQEEVFQQIVSTFEMGAFGQDRGFAIVETDQSQDIPPLPVPYYSQRDPRWIHKISGIVIENHRFRRDVTSGVAYTCVTHTITKVAIASADLVTSPPWISLRIIRNW